MRKYKKGFTIVELMVVVAVIGLLAVVGVPSYVRAREVSFTNACINNLRQIDAAKDMWAFDNSKGTGDPVSAGDLDSYLKRGFAGVEEPIGGTYQINAIGTDPECSEYDGTAHPTTI
jgi:prepilin-type N-terminal cleavage/methylation domain-containing protein